jgi:hypothetical protein
MASVAAALAAAKAWTNNAAHEPSLSELTAQSQAEQAQEQLYSPPQAEFSFQQDTVYAEQGESALQSASFEMVPQEKYEELMEQYAHLSDRFKRLVEERDSLSRQVSELKRAAAEQSQTGASQGHDYKEEIRLLGKLIDDEQALRSIAKPGDELYARHDRFVNVFLNIVARSE